VCLLACGRLGLCRLLRIRGPGVACSGRWLGCLRARRWVGQARGGETPFPSGLFWIAGLREDGIEEWFADVGRGRITRGGRGTVFLEMNFGGLAARGRYAGPGPGCGPSRRRAAEIVSEARRRHPECAGEADAFSWVSVKR